MLTQERLLQVIAYDKDTGVFTRLDSGKPTGTVNNRGYVCLKVDGKSYLAHRLAWLYVYGVWPENYTDHIDRNKTNNSIQNLRDVTNSQNQRNVAESSSRGVWFDSSRGKFTARIKIMGKLKFLGRFTSFEAAKAAYDSANLELKPT